MDGGRTRRGILLPQLPLGLVSAFLSFELIFHFTFVTNFLSWHPSVPLGFHQGFFIPKQSQLSFGVLSKAIIMPVHNGAIISLNCLSFGTSPTKTRDEEHTTVVESFKAAKAQGAQPGAIVLQDYEFKQIDLLVKLLNEAAGTDTWKAVRQWGDDSESLLDAVVLYDKAVYAGTDIEKATVAAFRDNDDLLAGMQPSIKEQLSGFIGRWAGLELEVLNSSGKTNELMFILVSYHGRKIVKANNDILPVQTAVKAAMAKDFIAQVADLGAKDAAPALIAGCWNIDSTPLEVNGGLCSDELSKGPWKTSVHHSEHVEKDKVGQPMNKVDYSVAVHPAEGASATTDLNVVEVITLEHPADIASHFQHKPLLVKFTIAPKA